MINLGGGKIGHPGLRRRGKSFGFLRRSALKGVSGDEGHRLET